MERTKLFSIISIVALGGLVGLFSPMYFISESNYNSKSEELNELWNSFQEMVTNYTDLLADYRVLSGDFDNLSSHYQILSGNYDDLLSDYQELSGDYDNLSSDYQVLFGNYNDLLSEYLVLSGNFTDLLSDYQDLNNDYQNIKSKYNALVDYLSHQILPVQYSTFAEAVRRNYLPIYLDNSTVKDWYAGFGKYCRDVILHDSLQNNSFTAVSYAFDEILKFGNDTMSLADFIMYETFWDWLPNWGGFGLTGNELTDIDTIHQWCIDEIDYEYDEYITYGQDSPTWDYPKFSVETAFRTMGDCEDQAILEATYLESCGYETAFVVNHDPDHPTLGAFYHGNLLVHIEDISAFKSAYPSAYLWNLGSNDPYNPDYTWCWLDPTWDVPFGTTPSWLQDYIDFDGGVYFDNCTIVLCDVNGTIF